MKTNEKQTVPPNSYIYPKLRELSPKSKQFFSSYISGDYYETAYTLYVDEQANLILRENHHRYG